MTENHGVGGSIPSPGTIGLSVGAHKHETAGRLRGTFGMVFRHAVATGRAQRDVGFDPFWLAVVTEFPSGSN